MLDKYLNKLRRVFKQTESKSASQADAQPPTDNTISDQSEILQTSWLFDETWYLQAYPEFSGNLNSALEHFLQTGAFEGRNPSAVFDTKWYARQAGISYAEENAVQHFIEHGAANKLSPCPLFDANFYLKTYPDISDSGVNPFSHYMNAGARERRRPNDLFIPLWYAEKNPGIENPIQHHLQTNSIFSPLFHKDWYEKRYVYELEKEKIGALAHYLNFGRQAEFSPNPYFDLKWYKKQYQSETDTEDAFAHFVRTGDASGNSPGRNFDSHWYRLRHSDIASSGAPAFQHFICSGEREGREFSNFNAKRRKISDIAATGYDENHHQGRAPKYEGSQLDDDFFANKANVIAFYQLKCKEENPFDDMRSRFVSDCKAAQKAGIKGFALLIRDDVNCKFAYKIITHLPPDFRVCLNFDSVQTVQRELRSSTQELKQILDCSAYFTVNSRPLIFIQQSIGAAQKEEFVSLKKTLSVQADNIPCLAISYSSSPDLSTEVDAFLYDPTESEILQGLPFLNERLDLPTNSYKVVGYTSLLSSSLQAVRRSKPVIKTIVPTFNNANSEGSEGFAVVGNRSERFEFWLKTAIKHSRADTVNGASIICINSWNNWKNSSSIEPDTQSGFAYLNATNRCISDRSNVLSDALSESSQPLKILLVGENAEDCSETRLLLKLARTLTRSFGVETIIVFRVGGVLETEFHNLTKTIVITDEVAQISNLLVQLFSDGFKNAIFDNRVAGSVIDKLSQIGFCSAALTASVQGDFRNYAFDLLKTFAPSLLKVSVSVPNYNYAHYMHERLGTIFIQNYPIYEIVVLDDCSTDDSLAVLEKLKKDGPRDFEIVPNQTNSGTVFKQWHKSAQICSGELIWIAEADDGASPEFLSTLAPTYYQNNRLQLIFTNSSQTDEQGKLLSDNYDEYYRSFKSLDFTRDFEVDCKEFLAKGLSARIAIANVSSALIRRKELLAVTESLRDSLGDLKVAGDWRIYIELCKRGGKIAFIHESLNVHRRHSTSLTHSAKIDSVIKELQTVHDLVYAEIRDPAIKEEQIAYIASVKKDHAKRELVNEVDNA